MGNNNSSADTILDDCDVAALDSIELLQISNADGALEDEEEDEEDEEMGWEAMVKPGAIVCEGLVLRNVKVLKTVPRGGFGKVVRGRTVVKLQCPSDVTERYRVNVSKVLFCPYFMVADPGVPIPEDELFTLFKAFMLRVKRAQGLLYLEEGRSFCIGSDRWLMVKACEPSSGGIFDFEDTEFHFTTDPRPPTIENVRFLPVRGERAPQYEHVDLASSLTQFLREHGPIFCARNQIMRIPLFRKEIIRPRRRNARKPDIKDVKTKEEIRKARLEFFEKRRQQVEVVASEEPNYFNISEVDMVEWVVMDVDPHLGGLIGNDTLIFCQGDAVDREEFLNSIMQQEQQVEPGDARQEQVLPSGGYDATRPVTENGVEYDRCLRCMRSVTPPMGTRILGRRVVQRPPIIYRCPCGQPIANSRHPVWRSLDQMLRGVETSQRPSVSFLQELRQVISVIPNEDPRSSILHSALNVFPRTRTGAIDYDQADRLVVVILPSLRQRVERVDPQVLARLPTNSFGEIKDSARIRGETDCCICMEAYNDQEIVKTLPCFHFFHQPCIDRWLSGSKTCPICKFQVD